MILAVAALLLLYGLGAPRLWQDEAETALLGRNILRFGLPRVWDGNNLVAQYYALDFDSHLLYQKSWLPLYLAAGAFALLGQGTFTARLPFALCGLVTVWLIWRVGRKLTGDGPTAVLAALLLALSLPFLLYSRQCRWYAPAMAVTLLLVEAEERLAERWGWLRFGAAIGLLFHLNYLVCGATAPALVAARLSTRGWRSIDRRMIAGLSAAALLTLPFFAFFPPFAFAEQVASTFSDYPSRMAWVLGDLNRYLLPLPGIAVLSALAGGRLGRSGWTRRLAVTILLAVVLSNLTLWPRDQRPPAGGAPSCRGYLLRAEGPPLVDRRARRRPSVHSPPRVPAVALAPLGTPGAREDRPVRLRGEPPPTRPGAHRRSGGVPAEEREAGRS
ncbi:MAG: hypothetical protein DMD79_23480, partial [Candidatus Rokuibacteriota bacterium]